MVGRSVWLVLGRQSDAAAVALSAVGQTEELSVRPRTHQRGTNERLYLHCGPRRFRVSLSPPPKSASDWTR